MLRLLTLSCRPLALMYFHTLEVTSARVIGPLPTTPSSAGERLTGLFRALFLAAMVFPFLCSLDAGPPRRPHPSSARVERPVRPAVPDEARSDRKSTPLNSSHVNNSYAVLCLNIKRSSRNE